MRKKSGLMALDEVIYSAENSAPPVRVNKSLLPTTYIKLKMPPKKINTDERAALGSQITANCKWSFLYCETSNGDKVPMSISSVPKRPSQRNIKPEKVGEEV